MPTLLAGKLKSSGLAFIFGVVARLKSMGARPSAGEVGRRISDLDPPTDGAAGGTPSYEVLLYPRNTLAGGVLQVFLCWFLILGCISACDFFGGWSSQKFIRSSFVEHQR